MSQTEPDKPKTPIALLRKMLKISAAEMAYDLGCELNENKIAKLEAGTRRMTLELAEKTAITYMVHRDWVQHGDPTTGWLIDIEGKHRTSFTKNDIRVLKDRFLWGSLDREDIDADDPYAAFLAWIVAGRWLASKIERPEDIAEVSISIPYRPDPDKPDAVRREYSLADALKTDEMWDKAPLRKIDCLLSGSEQFRQLDTNQQLKVLEKCIAQIKSRTAKRLEEMPEDPKAAADLVTPLHQKVWDHINAQIAQFQGEGNAANSSK